MLCKQHAARHAHVGRLPLIDTPLRVLDLELQFVLLLLQFHGRSLDKEVLLRQTRVRAKE